MTEATDASKPGTDSVFARDPKSDLELWKHYASFGGEDKNRMVTINSWLLGLSAATLGYIVTRTIAPDSASLDEPIRAFALAVLGLGVSGFAGFLAVLYGGYANRNWERADQIADGRGWTDLLPPPVRETRGPGLNGFAKLWARPCKPKDELGLVFMAFSILASLSFLAHFGVLIWSAVAIWAT